MTNDKEQINYPFLRFLGDLWSYIRPYQLWFWVGTILRLTGDLAGLYYAIALASVISFFQSYSTGQSLSGFWHILILWTLLTAWRYFSLPAARFFIFRVSEKAAIDAQLSAARKLFALDVAWHEKENSGNKIKKIQRGANGLDRIIRMWVTNYIEIMVNFIGIAYILSLTDWRISVVLLFFLVTYFTISFMWLRKLRLTIEDINKREEDVNGLLYQAASNIRSVKVLGIREKIYAMLYDQSVPLFQKIKQRIDGFQYRSIALNAWSIIFRFGFFASIGLGIYYGYYELSFLVLFDIYFSRTLESANELSSATQDLLINKLALARMQDLLAENEMSVGGTASWPSNWKKLELRNLSFSYGENKVLDNVSFSIMRGERIGIVGLSGAGKSTLFKLLLGENEGYEGEILVDDQPLVEMDYQDYYRHVGVVLQETEVFNFSLRENIAISEESSVDDMRLERAINIAHVADYLPRLPQGLDTLIGEKGVKLSGGEKQRLGIARAVYKQPQLLFLDEATSHLDLESEQKIQDSLQKFFQEVTAVVIAHRLTTIKSMDRILVIEGGKLIEQGAFEELSVQRGRFAELWDMQNL